MGLFCRHDMQFVGRYKYVRGYSLFQCRKCGKYFRHNRCLDYWCRMKYIDETEWIFKEERMNEK